MHPNTMQRTKKWVYGPMEWIGCVCCEKSRHDFVARTFALIAPVHPVLHRVSCSYEMIQIYPNTMQHTKTWVQGPMGRIWCVRWKKSRCDFVARTFALIPPFHPVLHRVSWSYETIPNASQHYATHQNISLGTNEVDWVCSLRKIPTWLRGTNFSINCISSHCFCTEFHAVAKR